MVDPQSVKFYGAVGDGVADDAPGIRDAFLANLGGRVYFPPGKYRLGSGLHQIEMTDSLLIESQNAVLINDHEEAQTFEFASKIVATPSLVGVVGRGNTAIQVDEATGIQPGDVLVLASENNFELVFGYKNRETHIVESIVGDLVLLADPVMFLYNAANDIITIQIHRPLSLQTSGHFRMEYANGGTEHGRFFDLFYLQGSSLSNLSITDPQRRKGFTAILLYHAVDTTIDKVFIEGCQYGIQITNGSRNTDINNITGQFCQHPVDFSTASVGCHINGLTGRANNATLGCHPCFDFQVRNVVANEDTDGYNHRAVGGSIENYRLVTNEPIASIQMQNVALVNDVYNEYPFSIRDFYVTAPNATIAPFISASPNSPKVSFDNVNVAKFVIGATGPVDVIITNSKLHNIFFRGNTLFASNIILDHALAGLDTSLREDHAFSLGNAKKIICSNVDVRGAYAFVITNHFLEEIRFTNLVYPSGPTNLFSTVGINGTFNTQISWSFS